MTDRKSSNFPGSTEIAASGYLSWFTSGVNYKISYSDFVTQLGVTGTLAQDGAVTGTPVLDGSSPNYLIRNIENGPGVKASVSPKNGITIEHNLNFNQTGAALTPDATAEQVIIRSIVGRDGINVAEAGDEIILSVGGAPVSNKTVLIDSVDDFPAPVGGVITLADETFYFIRDDINVGVNRFALGMDTVFGGSSRNVITLTYTGTDTLFTTSTGAGQIQHIGIEATSGTLIDCNVGLGNIFVMAEISYSVDTFGTFTGTGGVCRFTNVSGTIATEGILFTGNWGVCVFENAAITLNGGTLFDLDGATFDALEIETHIVTLGAGTTFMSGLTASGNINAGGVGTMADCRFSGTGTILSGIAPGDELWAFRSCDDTDDAFLQNGLFQGYLVLDNSPTTGVLVDPANPSYGWRDIIGYPAYRSSGAEQPPFNVFKDNQRLYQFDTLARKNWYVYHIPHDYVPGTDVYLHVHWAHNSATVASGSVTWQARAMYAKGHNQEPFGTEVTNTFGEAASTTQYQHMVTEGQLSTSGGSGTQLDTDLIEADGLVIVELSVSSNTINDGSWPFVVTADVHYQSSNMATKNKVPNFFG